MKLVYKKKSCRLCKSFNLQNVYKLSPTPIGDDYTKRKNKKKFFPLKLDYCKNCGFVQLSHIVNPKKVYGDYIYVTKTSSGLPEHFKELVNLLFKKKFLAKNKKVLEIGCNDGTLLDYLKKKNVFCVGVDPANNLSKSNLKIYQSMFDIKFSKKINKTHGDFDCIIANNVIANIDDLDEVFNCIDNLLNENGCFVMETFSLVGLVKNNLIDNIYHEHLSYFSLDTFNKFLNKRGFTVIYADNLDVKGGSLRLIIRKISLNNNQIIHKSVSKVLRYEKKYISNIPLIFKKLKKINSLNKRKIQTYLKYCKKRKIQILGYGASVGTTTLIYYYKIHKYFSKIYDDESRRHYLYSPGSNILVTPFKENIIKNSLVLILSWRYANQIIRKNKKLFNKNFIKVYVPLPKPRLK